MVTWGEMTLIIIVWLNIPNGTTFRALKCLSIFYLSVRGGFGTLWSFSLRGSAHFGELSSPQKVQQAEVQKGGLHYILISLK
jgi:hypothetical protein